LVGSLLIYYFAAGCQLKAKKRGIYDDTKGP
jgi:hypothetical protein